MNTGKRLVLAMVVVATGFAGYAVWFHSNQESHLREAWGSDVLGRIRNPTQVLMMQLNETESLKPTQVDEITSAQIKASFDISTARGLVHVKHLLVKDFSYVWNRPADYETPRWEFALRFVDGQGQGTVLLFSPTTRHIFCVGSLAPIDMTVVINRLDEYCKSAARESKGQPRASSQENQEAPAIER